MGRPLKDELSPALTRALKTVRENIKSARKSKEMSQADLAKASGISTTTMNELESERQRDVRVSTLVSIAEALDMSLIDFFISQDSSNSSLDMEQLLQVSKTLNRIIKKNKKD